MSDFDATLYTISVRKETTEDGTQFVARVAELPDVELYAESAQDAYLDAIDLIETSKAMFDEDGMKFPAPDPRTDREYSGRLPLRVPRSLHRALVRAAEAEGVSLNQYAAYLLAQRSPLEDVSRRIIHEIGEKSRGSGIVDLERGATTSGTAAEFHLVAPIGEKPDVRH